MCSYRVSGGDLLTSKWCKYGLVLVSGEDGDDVQVDESRICLACSVRVESS